MKHTELQIYGMATNPVKPPCENCPDRDQQCHFAGHCERWTEYQRQLAEYREGKNRRREIIEYIYGSRAREYALKREGRSRR